MLLTNVWSYIPYYYTETSLQLLPHTLCQAPFTWDALFHPSSLSVFSYAPNTSCHHISIAFFDPYQNSTLAKFVFCMSIITKNKTCITLHCYNFKGLPSYICFPPLAPTKAPKKQGVYFSNTYILDLSTRAWHLVGFK